MIRCFTTLFLLCAVQVISVLGGGNNAGKDEYKGVSTDWSSIELITSDGAPWVHFVYMLADNNLDSSGVSDLNEMRQNNASVNELSLVVYVDRCYNCDDSGVLETVAEIYDYNTKEPVNGKFNGSKILQKAYDETSGKHIWYQMYDFGHELDSTLSINVGNFTQLFSQFENSRNTEYYALTFWDHGGAWSGYGSDDNTAGSEKQQISTLSALFKAVSNGIEATYIGRLDLLGFDACIMADYSVLHSILDVDGPSIAQYYLASEVSEPGEGWDYTGLMAVDNVTGMASTPIDYGIAIIDSYVHQTDEIATADYGAGYTLALFDLDKVSTFTNEFDSLVKMMTYAVNNYDYAMLMSVLRGQSNSLAAEADFYIYDLGLFLDGLIDSEFFNTCPTRYTNVADNVLTYWNDSLLYFDADFLRSDLTGESIFYSTNTTTLSEFTYYNRDLASDNYVEFLEAVSTSLSQLSSNSNGGNLFTNATCHSPIPSDLTFYLNDIEIEYNSNYGLYKIVAQCGQAVMSAETNVYLHLYANDTSFDIGLASIDTKINDVSLRETELEVFWDGKIALFSDDSNNEMDMNKSTILSTSSIEYYFGDGVPIGYTIQYPVKIYQVDDVTDSKTGEISIPDDDGIFTAYNTSEGYLQVYVLISSENQSWSGADITTSFV